MNSALAQWRETLARTLSAEQIAELESHLREAMETIRAGDLTEEERWLVALRRLGRGEEMRAEFAKEPAPRTRCAPREIAAVMLAATGGVGAMAAWFSNLMTAPQAISVFALVAIFAAALCLPAWRATRGLPAAFVTLVAVACGGFIIASMSSLAAARFVGFLMLVAMFFVVRAVALHKTRPWARALTAKG